MSYADGSVNAAKRPTAKGKARKRRVSGLDRDRTRRTAFKVLALLADLEAADREKVLKCALRIHRA